MATPGHGIPFRHHHTDAHHAPQFSTTTTTNGPDPNIATRLNSVTASTAYSILCKENRHSLKSSNPSVTFGEVRRNLPPLTDPSTVSTRAESPYFSRSAVHSQTLSPWRCHHERTTSSNHVCTRMSHPTHEHAVTPVLFCKKTLRFTKEPIRTIVTGGGKRRCSAQTKENFLSVPGTS